MNILDNIFQRPTKHFLMRKKYLYPNNQSEKGLNYELALIDLDKRKILLKGVGADVGGEESSIQKQINAFLLGLKYSGVYYTLKVKVMEELDTPKAPTVYYPQKTSTELSKEIENRQNVHRETFFDDDENFTPLSPNNIEECTINVDFLKKQPNDVVDGDVYSVPIESLFAEEDTTYFEVPPAKTYRFILSDGSEHIKQVDSLFIALVTASKFGCDLTNYEGTNGELIYSYSLNDEQNNQLLAKYNIFCQTVKNDNTTYVEFYYSKNGKTEQIFIPNEDLILL